MKSAYQVNMCIHNFEIELKVEFLKLYKIIYPKKIINQKSMRKKV